MIEKSNVATDIRKIPNGAMNKVLLVSPPSRNQRQVNLIPIGLLSIGGFLRKYGYAVKVYNSGFSNQGSYAVKIENTGKMIKEYAPAFIGLGFPTDAFDSAVEIAKVAKELNKEVIVIVGGIHPTAKPIETISVQYFDFLVHGEGEITTRELFDALIAKSDLAKVNGISFKKGGTIMNTEPRSEICDFDEIPFDNRDLLIDFEKYPKRALGQIHTSRGCPYHCAYCSSSIIWKKKVRFRSIENVMSEIDYLYSRYRVNDINFADDNFTLEAGRVQAICEEIIKRKFKINWRCCARADIHHHFDLTLLRLMRTAGCRQICIGFESGAQGLLDNVDRGVRVSDMAAVLKIMKDSGIELHADFIIGLPGENEATLRETFRLMRRIWEVCRPMMTVALFKPYPGTDAYRKKDSIDYARLYPEFKKLFTFAEAYNIKRLFSNPIYVGKRLLDNLFSPRGIWSLIKKGSIPLEITLKKTGLSVISTLTRDRFFRYYKELERNQWLEKDELEQLQLAKLKRLITYAIKNIPFYKRRFDGFDAETIKSPDDIRALPILTKQELEIAGEDAIAKGQGRLISKNTSGTTGPPFHFVINRDFFSLEIARNLRIFDLPGSSIGDHWVIFTPLRGKKNSIFSFLTNRLVLDANRITVERTPPCCPSSTENQLKPDETTIRQFCTRIRSHKPKAIYSYPSALIALATFVRKWGIPGIYIKTIVSSGEFLTTKIRTFIEETFDGEVFNLYGTTEFPSIAEECREHNGLHIFNDSYVVEFLNDGAIVITDLDNYTMPFIRFKTGDRGLLKNGQCNCGRAFPLMEITEGRVSDLIVTPDGKFLRRSFFASLIRKNPEVEEFEIIQNEQGKIVVSLSVSKPLTEARREFLIKRFREYTGDSVDINAEPITDTVALPKVSK